MKLNVDKSLDMINDFVEDRAEIKFKENLHLGCDDYDRDWASWVC